MSEPVSLSATEARYLRLRLLRFGLVLLAVLGLALLWQFGPWHDALRPVALLGQARQWGARIGPLWALLAFTAALCVSIPLSVLSLLCLAVYGTWTGLLLCFSAAGLSCMLSHQIGRLLGHELVLRWAGPRGLKLSQALGRRGVWAVVLMRCVPVAPFALLNMLAGATHISLWQMLFGTLIGICPAMTAMALFLQPLLHWLG